MCVKTHIFQKMYFYFPQEKHNVHAALIPHMVFRAAFLQRCEQSCVIRW